MSLSVCLYFDVFGQAIFTVNQVSPVTSSVGPARHTLHTLVFERNSFEFHRLTWKLKYRVENTKKQTRKFRKASKFSTWLFKPRGWWKVRARISPFFAQAVFHRFCGFFRFIPWVLSMSFFVVFSFSRVFYMFTIPRCSQQWQCCRAGCISGLTTAQLAIECDESPHAVPVAISLESRRRKKCSLGKTAKAFSFVFVIFFRQRPNSTSAVQLHAGPWAPRRNLQFLKFISSVKSVPVMHFGSFRQVCKASLSALTHVA